MPTISEPLTEQHSWTYTRCRAAFITGQIGPVTFLVSLQLLGLSPRDAEAEVNLARWIEGLSHDYRLARLGLIHIRLTGFVSARRRILYGNLSSAHCIYYSEVWQ